MLSAKTLAFLLGVISGLALIFAIVSERYFGYPACELCQMQRRWHLVILLMGLFALWPEGQVRHGKWFLFAQGIAALGGFGYAIFHIGVEQHWWHATAACVGVSDAPTKEALLQQILSAPLVRCDEVRWHFLGLSMACYNAILSFVMACLAFWGIGKLK